MHRRGLRVKAISQKPGGKRASKQAIGRSRGGRNTKVHALADARGRLFAILPTGSEAHDCPVAEPHRHRQSIETPDRRQGLRQRQLRLWLKDRGTSQSFPTEQQKAAVPL